MGLDLVHPGLYLGSLITERGKDTLMAAGITHILQVAEGLEPSHPALFRYCCIRVQDAPDEDLVAHFRKGFAFIEEAISQDGAVLVHCGAGISRSVTVVIGFLMSKLGLQYEEALRQVQAVRPCAQPNRGFREQLLEFGRIGCDLTKWVAWRHRCSEQPYLVVSMQRGEAAEEEGGPTLTGTSACMAAVIVD